MGMVLKEAGIKETDVASTLGLSMSLIQTWFGFQEILNKWQEQESDVSWKQLAEAVREKFGVNSSQIILEISGEGKVDAPWFLQDILWPTTVLCPVHE